jgi:hypothetical protein
MTRRAIATSILSVLAFLCGTVPHASADDIATVTVNGLVGSYSYSSFPHWPRTLSRPDTLG